MATFASEHDRASARPPGSADERSSFTVGGVVARFIAIVRGDVGPLLIFAVVLAGLLPYGIGLAYGRLVPATVGAARLRQSVFIQPLVLQILQIPLSILLQGAVVQIGLARRPGFDLGPPSRAAFRHFVPNLGIYVTKAILLVLGYALFIVPGVILTCRWLVALQAEVAEGTGVLGALRRSGELTKGYRWRILGLVLLGAAVALLLVATRFLLVRALIGTSMLRPALAVFPRLVSTLDALVFAVGATATYVELRRVKEGGTPGEIASVFD